MAGCRYTRFVFVLFLFCLFSAGEVLADVIPVKGVDKIVFAVRKVGKDGHWYANFGYLVFDENEKMYTEDSQLCILDCKTGMVSILLNDIKGTFRDPIVHYNGKKILFSYRKGGTDYFHLYEINIDGTGLKQLTDGPFDDMEPAYLPDGDIIFISSRCRRWVPCWKTQVAILYRCKADGTDIHPLSSNIEQENTPWVLPDGRICYTRWEYVDRSRVNFHGLWSMNPDGTEQMTLFGNMHPGILYIDAKPIPGIDKLIMVHSPGHGKKEHGGDISILTLNRGPDDLGAEKKITGIKGNIKNRPNMLFRDPFPISKNSFLIARGPELLLMDAEGNYKTIYKLPQKWLKKRAWLHEPRPIRPRPKEKIICSKVDRSQSIGKLIVLDTTFGRNMKGVKKGEIKKLLILEDLPKPINFSGGMEPLTYGGSFGLKRILGTVPVEPDGSAYMEVPAMRSLLFVALDENDLSVKRMQSFLTVMPGETRTCIGCHENRTEAVPVKPLVRAVKRPPSIPEPVPGMPEIFDYPRDIQPILDKHCLSCHDVKNRKGGVLLTGDNGPVYTHSFYMLSARLQIADGRDLARGNYAPRKIGSSASYLMNKVNGSHHGVRVSDHESRKLKLWIDASATFPGTYASMGSGMINSIKKGEFRPSQKVMKKRCAKCHDGKMKLPGSPVDNLKFAGKKKFYNKKKSKYWTPPWVKPYGDGSLRPGSLEWMKKYADPRMQYSRHILYNLSFPERSILLMAPLSKSAGGYGICGDIFKNKSDPDYKILLEGIENSKKYLETITRFNMDNFQPTEQYVREMKRFGILSPDFKYGSPIDVYRTDQKYWESMYLPVNK